MKKYAIRVRDTHEHAESGETG